MGPWPIGDRARRRWSSPVDPQTVFGAAPGELFVVRNVAALVPVYSPDPGQHGTSAALEFGIRVLKVPASWCWGDLPLRFSSTGI
jgi:Carbonic anhydrase